MNSMGYLEVPIGEFRDAEPAKRELADREQNVGRSLHCRSSIPNSALHVGNVELTFIRLDRGQSTAHTDAPDRRQTKVWHSSDDQTGAAYGKKLTTHF